MGLAGRRITMNKKPFFDHFKELNIRIIASLTIVLIFAIIVYANYSTIYNGWCKDMINHRLKMRKMSEKKKGKKDD